MTKRTRSGEMEELMRQVNRYLIGWMGHYRLAGTPSVYKD
ncbi:MAG: hypothetical protein HY863_21010 [Chloroflexi bacterium]|nr:hypothetical protein [Chloroflexota bacterium]